MRKTHMPKKKPPIQNSQFFGGQRNDYDWDGTTVKDVLDYYFPEWFHADGHHIRLAKGMTFDGFRFLVVVPADRCCVSRYESEPGVKLQSWKSILLDDPKEKLLTFSREGDSYDETTDKRYLMMVKDLCHKCQ